MRRHPTRLTTLLLTTITALLLLVLSTVASAAVITDEQELGSFGSEGEAAGQLSFPENIGNDPTTGDVYVYSAARVNEFTPWGGFIKAFGWGVGPGAVDETQAVRVRAAAGTFTLSFEGQKTGDLPFDATAAEVKNALASLSTIGGTGGEVAVEALPGDPATETPYVYVIVFKGSLAGTNVSQLVAADGSTPLSGGRPTTGLEVRTRADGTPGGSGLESCTAESGCQRGTQGGEAGEIDSSVSIAVDTAGNVYLAEQIGNAGSPRRVQKFDSAGRFVWMIGGQVDKTAVHEREQQEANKEPVTITEAQENLCTAASGDQCGAPVSGGGHGEFELSNYQPTLALAPGGAVLVASAARVQRFNASGQYVSQLEVPAAEPHGIREIAVNQTNGDLYLLYAGDYHQVHELDATTGNEVATLKVDEPDELATDASGDLFVAAGQARQQDEECAESSCEDGPYARVIEFGPEGHRVSVFGEAEQVPGAPAKTHFTLPGLGTSILGDLYVSNFAYGEGAFVRFFGPPPVSLEPPPLRAPEVSVQYAKAIGTSSALLEGRVNPEFWADTGYHVEYGTEPCSLGGCASTPAADVGAGVVRKPVLVAPVVLEGLSPGTRYYYRFVAESSGGGPVYGVAPEGGEASAAEGLEGSFVTYRSPTGISCPANEVFRTGASALLPDCRAYEMVSPIEKEGAGIRVMYTANYMPGVLVQSSVSGGKLVYGSARAFGDAQSAPSTAQYMAVRLEGAGWESRAISPPRERALEGALNRYSEFKLFTPNLCTTWIESLAEPPLAKGAPAGQLDLYRQELPECGGSGAYVPLNTTAVPGGGGQFLLQGVSEDRETAVFTSTAPLAPGGTSGAGRQLYGSQAGVEKFLCVLPGGTAFKESCSAGWGSSSFHENEDQVTGALSADGQRVYWTAGTEDGPIYLRENPFASGRECSAESSPCTLAVSKAAEVEAGTTGEGSRFWAAAADGSKAIFTTGKLEGGRASLYEYGLSAESTQRIAGEVFGVLGVSRDANRVYFVSREALGGEDPQGGRAAAGERNLYLYDATQPEGERVRFIGTLASSAPTLEDGSYPTAETYARVGAGGKAVAFESTASLTGYVNKDVVSGKPDAEVFLYREEAEGGNGSLVCASCNPTGARPQGQEVNRDGKPIPAAAAWIPAPENLLYASRVLSETGNRLFFNSFDSLSPRDKNGQQDVYEWEAAGEGSCTESSGSFSSQDGGCVELISSGQSTVASEFWDATPSGSNVFFTTLSSLVPQDPGLVDMYDARVDGGLPSPAEPSGCAGEACQSPASPPGPVSFGSLAFEGPGNLTPVKPNAGKGKAGKKAGKAKARARKLHRALKRCRKRFKHNAHKRRSCKQRARRRFGAHARRAGRHHHRRKR